MDAASCGHAFVCGSRPCTRIESPRVRSVPSERPIPGSFAGQNDLTRPFSLSGAIDTPDPPPAMCYWGTKRALLLPTGAG